MDILDRTLNPLDYADTEKSLKEIENYLNRTMETIDYTLSRQRQQISGGIDPAQFLALAQRVGELINEVSSVSAAILSLNGDVRLLKENTKGLENSVSGLAGQLSQLSSAVEENTKKIQDHEERISALENTP